ncbi:MAG: hypothetical protein MUF00_08690 [Gemmatimonadaceae bacterium]|jgi:hypothetical protein|nr:hypothetical protein [Gemmatimonadaceae bacterium]
MKTVRTDQLARLLVDAGAAGVAALRWHDWVAEGAALAEVSPAVLEPAARLMWYRGYVQVRSGHVSLSPLGRTRLAAIDRDDARGVTHG